MTTVQGRVLTVTEEIAGSEAVGSYPLGTAITIQVGDTYPFSLGDDGQQVVEINGVLHFVLAIDYEAETITFEENNLVAINDGDDIRVIPYGSVKVAMLDLEDDDEGITAIIPMELHDRFVTGIRDPLDRESVFADDESGRWVLSAADDEIPSVGGAYIDPEGMPDPVPLDPPGTSPTLAVTGLPTSLVARAVDDVAPSSKIQYHMSLTNSSFVPALNDPLTLVEDTNSRVVLLDRTPDGQPLIADQIYYISAIAYNSAGAAPPSAPLPAVLDLGAIAAVVAAEVIAEAIFAKTVEIGDITIDADDGIRILQPDGYIHFPADGSLPAKFVGDVETSNLVAKDRLDIVKLAQVFGTIRANAGVTNPTAPPSFAPVWDKPSSAAGGAFPNNNWGLVESIWTGGGAKWVSVTDFFNVFIVLDAFGNQVGGGGVSPMPANFYPTSIVRTDRTAGNPRYYVLGSLGTAEGSEPWIYVFTHTAMNTFTHVPSESFRAVPLITSGGAQGQYEKDRWTEFDSSAHYGVTNVKRPALGTTGTGSIYMVRYHTFSGATRAVVRAWNVLNVGVLTAADRNIHTGTAVLASLGGAPVDIVQSHAMLYDFSAVRWILITPNNNYVYSSTVTSGGQYVRVAADDWLKAISAGTTRGMGWDSVDQRFYSLDTSGSFWKYVKAHVNNTNLYAKYTWRDNDIAGSGKHETAGSTAGVGTWYARSKIRITGQVAPERDSTANDAADQVNIYASSTLGGTYRLQHADGALILINYFDLETLDTTIGAVVPATTSFDAAVTPGYVGAAGKIESGKLDGAETMWNFYGSGEWKLGKMRADAAGHITPEDAQWWSIGLARTSTISVVSGTWTGFAMNFTGWNPGGAAHYGTPSGYIQVAATGVYQVVLNTTWQVATPGTDAARRRLSRIYSGSTLVVQTGAMLASNEQPAFAGNEVTYQTVVLEVYLTAGDYLIPQVWHGQGSNITVTGTIIAKRVG